MTQPTAPRGFVMVLVLLLVAVLTAIVVGQLSVVRTQRLTAIRDNDQVQARAIAERCLARARIYLEQVREERRPPDWDIVLDPNLDSHPVSSGGNNKTDDDFVPVASFGGSIVYVPKAESTSTGLRQALHRWRLVDMDGGACLVRFDDNADDFRPPGGKDNSSTTDKYENNPNRDAPNRDSDMGIFINAIGIFPKLPATAAVDAYDRARARVAVKTFIGTGGAPGIVARDDVVVESNVALCGLGGLQADLLTYSSSGSPATVCACGDTSTSDIASATHPGDCLTSSGPGMACDPALTCQPGSGVSGAPKPQPDVKVPTPVHWLELDGFQDPLNPKSLGDNGVCEFYFRSDNVKRTWTATDPDVPNDVEALFMSGTSEFGEIFVWDHTDNDAQGCRTPGTTLNDCSSGQLVTHNCSEPLNAPSPTTTFEVDGKRVVKRPCAWPNSDPTQIALGPTVHCNDPGTETPCWKLVGRLTTMFADPPVAVALQGGAIVQQDMGRTASLTCSVDCALSGKVCGPTGTCVTLDESREHTRAFLNTDRDRAEEVFTPKENRRIPNIERFWGDPAAGGSAAGAAASRNDGTAPSGIASGFWSNLCNAPAPPETVRGWQLISNEHFHFDENPMCGSDFFNPAILAFENQAQSLANNNDTARFHVLRSWGGGTCGTDIPRTTIIVQGHADIDLDTRVCGTWSDCSTFPAPCTADSASKANGLVLRAGGECYVGSGAVFIGDMQCGVIHVNNGTGSDCIVGDLIAFNDRSYHPIADDALDNALGVCPAASVTSGFVPDCSRGFCANQSFKMVGDLISSGDICIRSGAEIYGSVLGGGRGDVNGDSVTDGHVFIESNVTVHGQLVSEGHLGIKSGVTVNNNGTGIFGSRVTSGIRVDASY